MFQQIAVFLLNYFSKKLSWYNRYYKFVSSAGYGDIHAVNVREMIFIMIYVSFDMVLGAYLVGNMTAMIVKGSATERFRDRMKEVIRYMNRNKLGKDIREQIKGHLRLQYESSCTEASVLRDIPISIRSKVGVIFWISCLFCVIV
jgi:hyperpolarization activated cyclic nucleotide-gated potassium channel 4